ncbi:uncharacterized protein LOC130508035 [Raphanus sativus]|uniref:Uncharacterized protein LOC108838213 isoform X1 n=1 Tax=Raphanus sativus TaxID=3726 RepID=A0A6J0M3L3_RAPSA|nr:uncharacterized protein LOC108838213 isoform X1 [Raphanus sativus]XP_056859160.1 uncharacterized protein LOC130508035 [Raphanus sativus]
MDGLKVLASGFQIDEKVKIEKLVTSMEGVLVSRTSSDVNFVIVKNVLAAKYKYIGDFLRTEAFEREERFTMQYAPLVKHLSFSQKLFWISLLPLMTNVGPVCSEEASCCTELVTSVLE